MYEATEKEDESPIRWSKNPQTKVAVFAVANQSAKIHNSTKSYKTKRVVQETSMQFKRLAKNLWLNIIEWGTKHMVDTSMSCAASQ